MRRNLFLASFVIAAATFGSSPAFALGIGAYMDAFGGESDRVVYSNALERTGGKSTNYGFKAGLLFDTCAACDQVFNYRLKVGGGLSKGDLVAKTNYNSFHMSHTFGFAAISNDVARFWIGPQIGFSYLRGSSNRWALNAEYPGATYALAAQNGIVPSPSYFSLFQIGIFKERTKYSSYRGDAGLAFGVNLHLGDYVSLGLEAGVTYGYALGRQDREVYYAGGPIIPYNRFKDRYREQGVEGYGSVTFMFRFLDTFQ